MTSTRKEIVQKCVSVLEKFALEPQNKYSALEGGELPYAVKIMKVISDDLREDPKNEKMKFWSTVSNSLEWTLGEDASEINKITKKILASSVKEAVFTPRSTLPAADISNLQEKLKPILAERDVFFKEEEKRAQRELETKTAEVTKETARIAAERDRKKQAEIAIAAAEAKASESEKVNIPDFFSKIISMINAREKELGPEKFSVKSKLRSDGLTGGVAELKDYIIKHIASPTKENLDHVLKLAEDRLKKKVTDYEKKGMNDLKGEPLQYQLYFAIHFAGGRTAYLDFPEKTNKKSDTASHASESGFFMPHHAESAKQSAAQDRSVEKKKMDHH